MKLLNRLERSFSRYAIPNVTVYLLFFQCFTFFACLAKPEFITRLMLSRDEVLHGQWWRIFSFMLMPPTLSVLWLIPSLYFFWLMGTGLESHWGTFRYNLYLLIGYVATVAAAMLVPGSVATNAMLLASVLVAYAWLFPETIVNLFFFFPVALKWVGFLAWIFYLIAFLNGNWSVKALVLAAVLNFLLFFHGDLRAAIKNRRRRAAISLAPAAPFNQPFHTCAVCGVTDQSNRTMEFRYCPFCAGTPGYCIEHINNHVHKVK